MTMWPFVIILVLLAVNGFFVALEFALVGSRSSRLEPLAESGDRSAARALAAMRDLNAQLAGAQLGITIASLLLGMLGEPAIAHLLVTPLGHLPKVPEGWVHPIAAVIALLIVVFAHMVFGEMVPKNITLSRPESTLRVLTGPNRPYLTLARPFVTVLNVVANVGVRMFGVEPRDELVSAHTSQELAALVAASKEGGVIPDTAAAILSGVLDFGGREVRSMMVRRDAVSTVSASDAALDAEQLFAGSAHTRLIVVGEGGVGDVLGFLHSKDLLTLERTVMASTTVGEITRVLPVAAADSTVEPVMLAMQATGVHIAKVVDPDDGSMVGIVTLDDLLGGLLNELTGGGDPRGTATVD
jgi:CBS domain containing-hemolysin-like protein